MYFNCMRGTGADAELAGDALFWIKSHFHGFAVLDIERGGRADGDADPTLRAQIPVHCNVLGQGLDFDSLFF